MAEKGKIAEAFVDIVGNLKPLKEALARAHSAVRTSVRAMNRSFRSVSRAFRGIGTTISSVATRIRRALKWTFATIAGAIGTSIYMAGKFEEQLAMVSTMLSQKTMPYISKYKQRLTELATSFGQSTKTLSKSLYDILSASIDASKATEVLGVAAKAAIAGMTETAVATDALTSILNAYQFNASKAGEVSDKLFATVKRGKTTFAEIAASIGRTAATAAVAGLNLDELLAMLATMTRMGIKTDEAMTSLNGVIRAFLSPTDEAKEVASELGIELSSNTLRSKGLIRTVKELKSATTEQLAAIIPNIRAFKGLAAALQDLEGLEEDYTLISQRSAGMTEEAYSKMASTFQFKFNQVKESLKALAVAFGETLSPQAKDCLDMIKDKLEKARGWIEKNKDRITEWADTIKDTLVPKLEDVWDWLEKIYNRVKEEGWKEAFEDIGEDLVAAFRKVWADIEPYMRKAGEAIGAGILTVVKESTKQVSKTEKGKWYLETLRGATAGVIPGLIAGGPLGAVGGAFLGAGLGGLLFGRGTESRNVSLLKPKLTAAEKAISEAVEARNVPGYTRFVDVYKQNLQESLERVREKIEQVTNIKADISKKEGEKSEEYSMAERILDKLIAQEKRTNELLESILQKQEKNAGAIVY